MGCSKWKAKLSRTLCCNLELNRKALCIKHSWDEVAKILASIPGKGGCGCGCNKK